VIAYFDIDYFKAYNDRFGFRNGDRVLRMFADMLRDQQNRLRSFVGHIGGDDFFLGLQTTEFSQAVTEITSVVGQFRSNAEGFYDQDTLKKGYIISPDRDGKEKQFPLLTVSAAVLEIEADRPAGVSIGQIAELLAFHKKQAKQNPEKISIGRIFADKGDPAPSTLPDDGTCHDPSTPVLSLVSSPSSSPSQLRNHLRACGIREIGPDEPGEDHAA
jgi:GGDEF domain-containing protein